ncbi:FUSC family protein [Acetonema longum]|nr:aromatic acid exporter family protein [Acetonema longum]
MKIGARIIKTGIAVTITMYICKTFRLEPAFFGAVSAVVNMQPSIFLTFKTAWDQILVHILGVTAGIACGYLIGGHPIAMGLISIILILMYIKFNLHSGISTGIVAALFVVGSGQEAFLLEHALNRTAVIFTGLVTAMLVNILLWPPRYKKQFTAKLKESNETAVRYFCQAVAGYVQLENEAPEVHQDQREKVHQLNREIRSLSKLLSREGQVLASGSVEEGEWFVKARQLMDYNESLTEKADRIYSILPDRFDRRVKAGLPPISDEFKVILGILNSGAASLDRVNAKIRKVIIEGQPVEPEEINEDYWERLSEAIETWQQRLTGSYYVHALTEAAVTANELKRVVRQGKKLLADSTAVTI